MTLNPDDIEYPKGVSGPLTEDSSTRENHIGPEFDHQALPDGYRKYLSLEVVEDGYIANTDSYVGILPCANDTFLPIIPKTEVRNLSYFLQKSGRLFHDLDSPFDDEVPYETVLDELTSMHELFIMQLLDGVDRIRRDGLLKTHRTESVTLQQIEGQVDRREYGRRAAQIQYRSIPQHRETKNLNNIPNQFLKYTLEYIARGSYATIDDEEIYQRLDYFHPVESVNLTPELLDAVRRIEQEQDLPPSRQYYLAPLQQARFIIEEADISFGEESTAERPSFMFRMYDAYEDFIRNKIEDILRDEGYNVFDGNIRHRRDLYDSGSKERYELKPDIVVSDDMQDIAVLEVKYKPSLESTDHYQTWIYKQQYGVDRAALISIPTSTGQSGSEVYTRNRFRDSITNFRYSLADFSESNDHLRSFLAEMFGFPP
ncbi:McrC family protein [Salinibacter ruber]|uniref:5-methylcytosine-specific restriction endonuclease McrBC regulatory subunit McrC n=1 Tax=Salinibacter ruber TaxID=146919 RepID=A0A9X3AAM4_9BACT|nr:McrC family protein [Salinibacter ruber]MCS4123056.1 5-methylcytosine-specific restriction endonuclease McrBC regulatory subunit McrC [Salinibacter ruber]